MAPLLEGVISVVTEGRGIVVRGTRNMTEGNAQEIIIFEDNSVFSEILSDCVRLVYPNAQIVLFEKCAAGINHVENVCVAPLLALVDIGLPDISGMEAIKKINQRFPETSILVVTVMADKKTVFEAIRCGAVGYVLKDDPEVDIRRAVEQLKNGIFPLSPSLAHYMFIHIGREKVANGDGVLTQREGEILQAIADGKSYLETALSLGISLSTVQMHIRNLYRKLNVRSKSQAILTGRAKGLIQL